MNKLATKEAAKQAADLSDLLGVPRDFEQALKAAKQGDGAAQFVIAMTNERGWRGEPDAKQAAIWYRKAAPWFLKVAEQGRAEVQFTLGWMFEWGRGGLPQDDEQAVGWYRKAAEQSHANAQFNLGWLHFDGRGVPQDDAEAAAWFLKAAEQGFLTAQFILVRMYRLGQGVAKDEEQAAYWHGKVADQEAGRKA